jgi:hypothetical protein
MSNEKAMLVGMVLFGCGAGMGFAVGLALGEAHHQWTSRFVRRQLEKVFRYCDRERA